MTAQHWAPVDQGRARSRRLDHDRRQAVQDLVSLLTELVEQAHTMTAAALRGDADVLAEARTTLLELAANPALDLARVTEIYNGLRTAISGRQPPMPQVPSGIAHRQDGADPVGRISIAVNPGTGQDEVCDRRRGGGGVLPEDGLSSFR